MSSIFGGSKSKSTQQSTQSSSSSNKAYDPILTGYNPAGQAAYNTAIGARGDILKDGFEGYKEKANFNFFRDTGLKNLMGMFGSKGMLQSGAAAKGLQSYGQNMLSTLLNDYLGQQDAQAKLGLGVGNLLAGAGGISSSTGQSTGSSTTKQGGNMSGFLGSALTSFAASDRRVKKNIVKIGELAEGLNLYEFEYKDKNTKHVGVMADEVAEVFPEALGPVHAGFQTVNYDMVRERYGRF